MKYVYYYIPIRNLGWVYQDLVLDNIRKIRFIDELKRETDQLEKSGLFDARCGKYTSCLIIRMSEVQLSSGFEYITEIYKTIAFLRLFLNQDISFEKVFLGDQIIGISQESYKQKSSLSQKDNKLLSFWKKYSQSYSTKSMIFHWYSRVFEGLPPNERVVFLCISLEGLLLSDVTQELRYRFALRGSYLLAPKSEDRLKIFSFLLRAYDFRSAIVHCNEKLMRKTRKEINSVAKFVTELKYYTETLIKLYINNPKLFIDIDEKILKGNVSNQI